MPTIFAPIGLVADPTVSIKPFSALQPHPTLQFPDRSQRHHSALKYSGWTPLLSCWPGKDDVVGTSNAPIGPLHASNSNRLSPLKTTHLLVPPDNFLELDPIHGKELTYGLRWTDQKEPQKSPIREVQNRTPT